MYNQNNGAGDGLRPPLSLPNLPLPPDLPPLHHQQEKALNLQVQVDTYYHDNDSFDYDNADCDEDIDDHYANEYNMII